MLIYRIIDDLNLSLEDLEKLIASLPEWRRQQALKFKYRQGQLECAVSFSLLKEILGNFRLRADYGQITGRLRAGYGEILEFTRGEHGKPYIDGLYFNLSHCKKAIACIVSDEGEVGIDVECLGRYNQSLAEYCMSDAELQQIAAAEDPDAQFTLLWTKKEALLKYTGEGITDDMKSCLTSERAKGITIKSGLNKEKGYAFSIAF